MTEFTLEDLNFKKIKKGDIVKCIVMQVSDNEALLDLQYITEGVIYLDNYTSDPNVKSLKEVLKVNDELELVVNKISERDDSTLILLSRLPLLQKEKYNDLKNKFENKEKVLVKGVKQVNKGFIAKYENIEVFIPESQLTFNYKDFKDTEIKDLIGKDFYVNIIDFDQKKRKIVGSRNSIVKDEYFKKQKEDYELLQKNKEEELSNIKVNDVIEGTIEDVRKYGLLIKFKYNFGLARISELSHRRITDINKDFKNGDKITVKVIKKDNNKLDLSLKALIPTDFEVYTKKFKKGDTVTGEVVQKLPYGLILKLDEYVTGLLHKNEYSWNPNDNFDMHVKIGTKVDVKILNFDKKKEQIALSKRMLEDNPWGRLSIKKGDVVEAKITEIIPGSLIKVETNGVDGTIHVNDLSTQRINKIEDLYQVGEVINAVVIDLNKENWILKLSVKILREQEEKQDYEKYMEEQSNADDKLTLGDLFSDVLKK